MRKLDAVMIKFVREHPQAWRRVLSGTYGLLTAWYLWDVVHQNRWWGIDFGCAVFMSAVWGLMAYTWGRHDRCDEIARLVVEALGDPDPYVESYAWCWAYRTPAWQQREIITWMRTHQLLAVHPDDMPLAMRDFAKFLVLLRP